MASDVPTETGITTTLYADDIAFWFSNKNPDYVVKKVQNYITDVEGWANKWGFKISQEKTQAIVFTNKIIPVSSNLQIGGKDIPYLPYIKYLGVYFDRRQTWRKQVEHLFNMSIPVLNLLRGLSAQGWGAERETLLKVYRALIRSRLEYCSILFEGAPKIVLNKLNTIQRRALQIVAGALYGTSLLSLQRELGEPPLNIR